MWNTYFNANLDGGPDPANVERTVDVVSPHEAEPVAERVRSAATLRRGNSPAAPRFCPEAVDATSSPKRAPGCSARSPGERVLFLPGHHSPEIFTASGCGRPIQR